MLGDVPGGDWLFASGPAVVVPGEELWIISTPPRDPNAPPPADDAPGSGALVCVAPPKGHTPPPGVAHVPVPLEHTDVRADIAGYIASVTVTQSFHNPFSEKIEAAYMFPLPQNAAVNGFLMRVGERTIRGIVREREEAEEIYREARSGGHVASLLTQERPNVFTQKVANIEPAKSIDVEITYFHTLPHVDGEFEWVFPMVVGPRYNPPGSRSGIGAVERGDRGASGQAAEAQYLAPHERSGHDVSLAIELDAGAAIESLRSMGHAIRVDAASDSEATITLASGATIPNRDFVLRYRVAGDSVKTGLVSHVEDGQGYFTLMLYPPAGLEHLERQPMELVFVLDCSGSMNGAPIEQAKRAVRHALGRLGPQDSFQIIRFSNDSSRLGAAPLRATPENIAMGRRYLDSLSGHGGTRMIEGIKAALDFRQDPGRLRFVCFLTDGFIGNEAEILGTMSKKLREARVFSFGVGSAPNRYLMDRMAKLGRGCVAYLGLEEAPEPVIDGFFGRVSRPALVDTALVFEGVHVTEVQPKRLPDLFVGRPVIVAGRFDPTSLEPGARVVVTGTTAGIARQRTIAFDPYGGDQHPALAVVWARTKIAELADRATQRPSTKIKREIERLALSHSLMSAYTAFVAVDSLTVTEGGHGVSVVVPVNVPDGVRYETAVGR